MSRAHDLYGRGNLSAMFGDAPVTPAPWGRAGGLKNRKDYEEDKVRGVLMHPDRHEMVEMDPRELKATQPSITRAGVAHYLSNPDTVYKDAHNAGNKRPVVYERRGVPLILSGHHRAASALLRGEQFKAVLVSGDYGAPR